MITDEELDRNGPSIQDKQKDMGWKFQEERWQVVKYLTIILKQIYFYKLHPIWNRNIPHIRSSSADSKASSNYPRSLSYPRSLPFKMLPSSLTAYPILLTPGITPCRRSAFPFRILPSFVFTLPCPFDLHAHICSERIDRSVFSLALPGARPRLADWRTWPARAQARFIRVHQV